MPLFAEQAGRSTAVETTSPTLSVLLHEPNEPAGRSILRYSTAVHSYTLLEGCLWEIQHLKSLGTNDRVAHHFLAASSSYFVHGNANLEWFRYGDIILHWQFVCVFPCRSWAYVDPIGTPEKVSILWARYAGGDRHTVQWQLPESIWAAWCVNTLSFWLIPRLFCE